MRVLVCAYRNWAIDMVQYIDPLTKRRIVESPSELEEAYKDFEPDLVVLLGWSWVVPKSIWSKTKTICLHPSPLPKYRGGCPIQHQIINGEKTTRVTFFVVGGKIDGGDVILQSGEIPLEGTLTDIFRRIIISGGVLLKKIVEAFPNISTYPQGEGGFSMKRRTPEQSELKIEDFTNMPAEELYNFIRALGDPYPNAFIRCSDGRRLYLKEVSLGT